MKRTLVSLGAGLLAAVLAYIVILFVEPTMYVEKAGNIIVNAFLIVSIVTALSFNRLKRER
ncbi:hypothetical protein [Massilia timonae]|uniref:hypothetical protein n=1 Tax=Massilia timonae TaxID=47229 RepID=UPI0028D8DA65|nr:hypothetical protein [Massilia timonae]